MTGSGIITITQSQYAHLPSEIHKLVVDALVAAGEWKIEGTSVRQGMAGHLGSAKVSLRKGSR